MYNIEEFNRVKEYALERHIPIIMDDTPPFAKPYQSYLV